jgi:HK97 family phage portal protein
MLSALFDRPQNVVNPNTLWQWADTGGGNTPSGVRVTEDNAAQLMAVYGSAGLITDEIATLPVNVDGVDRPRWVDSPSDGLDRIAWMGQIVWSIMLSGNAYLRVLQRGVDILAMDPLDPATCHVDRVKGRKVITVNGVESRNMLHIPGRMKPGSLVGMSPVEWCRQSIGIGMAAAQFGADQFGNELNMPGVIESPLPMQPETILETAKQWRKLRRNGGRGLPGVLQAGATWKATGITNEQAQFLQTRQFTAAEIAGQMFLLDPSDLGIPVQGTSLTYGNLEQRDVRRLKVALMPTMRRIESALSPYLFGGEYRFDVDARLRGNTRESYETLAVALAAGIMTVDEVREILGLPPRPDQTTEPTARELAEMIQKIYLGVGVVLSADEAREILNSGGANLPPNYTPDAPASASGGFNA